MERTFHGLRAVDKYILATSAVESLPPQVEMENLTSLIGGKLRGQKRRQASVSQAVHRVSALTSGLWLPHHFDLIWLIMYSHKQGFKTITVWTTVSNDRFRPNDDKSRCQVLLKRSYCYAAALDNGAVHPCGLVSLLGPEVTLQLLPLSYKNDGEGFLQ